MPRSKTPRVGRCILAAGSLSVLLLFSSGASAYASTADDHSPTQAEREAAREYVFSHPEEFSDGPRLAELTRMSAEHGNAYPPPPEEVARTLEDLSDGTVSVNARVGEVEHDSCSIERLNFHQLNIPNIYQASAWSYAGVASTTDGAGFCNTDAGGIYTGISFVGEAAVRGCLESSTTLVFYGTLYIGRKTVPAQIAFGYGTPTSAAIHNGYGTQYADDPVRDLTGAAAASLLDESYQHVNRCGPSPTIRHAYLGGYYNDVSAMHDPEGFACDAVEGGGREYRTTDEGGPRDNADADAAADAEDHTIGTNGDPVNAGETEEPDPETPRGSSPPDPNTDGPYCVEERTEPRYTTNGYGDNANDAEKAYCISQPLAWRAVGAFDRAARREADCRTARSASNLAGDQEMARFSGDRFGDGRQSNAFKHCAWSARMVQRLDSFAKAKKFGDLHESDQSDGPLRDMDLHNNARGRSIGGQLTTAKGAYQSCEYHARGFGSSTDDLRVFRGPGRNYPW